MNGDPQRYFNSFFRELEIRNIPYVILHSYENFPGIIASDIDYAVPDADLQKIPAIQFELARQQGWALAQSLQHQVCASYSVLVDLANPLNFLKLDVCSHYVKDHCFLLRDSTLLEGRHRFHEFYIPAPSSEFIYVLAKVFGKNKNIAGYLPQLRLLWQEDPEGAQKHFDGLFGNTGASLEEWFAKPPQDWATLNQIMRRKNRYGIALYCRELGRVIKRLMHPTGLRIALLGPDGVGKSTLLAQLQQTMEPCFRKQKVFHFRPMIFQKTAPSPVSDPHAMPPRNPAVACVKVFYYFFDYWLGWILQILPARLRSTLVIFDRNFDDMLVDQRRYRLGKSTALVRLLRLFLPHEDLVFVLDASPEIIHLRKPELSIIEIERQRSALRELAQSDVRYVLVPAGESPEKITSAVCRKIVEKLATRTQGNIGIPQ